MSFFKGLGFSIILGITIFLITLAIFVVIFLMQLATNEFFPEDSFSADNTINERKIEKLEISMSCKNFSLIKENFEKAFLLNTSSGKVSAECEVVIVAKKDLKNRDFEKMNNVKTIFITCLDTEISKDFFSNFKDIKIKICEGASLKLVEEDN